MSRADRLEHLIATAFDPAEVKVMDDSHKHAGHAGARPEGETHYRVQVISAAFDGQSRVQRHRAVNKAVQVEFDAGLHALQLQTLTPDEASKK